MPMGIVTDKDFDSELKNVQIPKTPPVTIPSTKPPVLEGEVLPIERGRGNGNIQTPDSIRKLIAETAASEGREAALALGKQFGLSESSIAAYSVGAKSTATYHDRPNSGIVDAARSAVQSRAIVKLKRALHHITDDKLKDAKPRELAGIARDMSAVVKAMEPETPKADGVNTGGGPAFVFYAPKFRKEEHYETVYAKE